MCTIHQPQAKIFHQFDRLLLLRSGIILYQGSSQYSLEAFENVGYPCPDLENPADHLLDTITPNSSMNSSNRSISPEAASKLMVEYGSPADVDLDYGSDQPLNLTREFLPWSHQYAVLFRRSLHEVQRKRELFITQLVQTCIMATLIGTAFLQIGNTQTSTTRRLPLLFFCTVNQGVFGALQVINSFPAERSLALRERSAGTYQVSAYFLAKTSADTLTQLLFPTIFSIIIYFASGLQMNAGKFFVFWVFMLFTNLAAIGLALAVSAVARTADLSVVVLPILLEVGPMKPWLSLAARGLLLASSRFRLPAAESGLALFSRLRLSDIEAFRGLLPRADQPPDLFLVAGRALLRKGEAGPPLARFRSRPAPPLGSSHPLPPCKFPPQYAYVGIALNELTDLTLVCTPSQLNSAGKCPYIDGTYWINSLVRRALLSRFGG